MEGRRGWEDWTDADSLSDDSLLQHLMYLSCQEGRFKKQCIAVAYTRGGPLGPYSFISDVPIISRVSKSDADLTENFL